METEVLSRLFLMNGSQILITNFFIIRYITFILSDSQEEVAPVPTKKLVKYSSVKKTCSDDLKKRFLKLIQLDRYYSTLAPLWNASISRFRNVFFDYVGVLGGLVVARTSSNGGGEEDDEEDGVVDDGDETALEREIRIAEEINRAKLLERML